MYTSCFQDHHHNKSVFFLFDVFTKALFKSNEDRPYCATKNQDIFVDYRKRFDFVTGKALREFKHEHMTIPNSAPSFTHYLEQTSLTTM